MWEVSAWGYKLLNLGQNLLHIDFCVDCKACTLPVFLVSFLTMLHALSVSEDPPRAHAAPEIPQRQYLVPLSTPSRPHP